MIFIDQASIRAKLDYRSFVTALHEQHHLDMDKLEDMLLEQPDTSGTPSHFFLRAAWQRGHTIGTKVISIFPNNPSSDPVLPAIQAVYLLFDGVDGKPLAVIDGTELTYWKTAGDSALGSNLLAAPNPQVMLMVGAGAMAPQLINAHCAVRPSLQRIVIWNRTRARAESLLADLEISLPEANRKIVITADLEQAVREADLISCATMTREPLISGNWLKPGVHLDLVGAYTPEMREADDEAFRRGQIFVDSRDTTIGEIGEIIEPMKKGIINESDIRADLYQLCRGQHPGRQDEKAITVYKNGGGGHLDLMTAKIIYHSHLEG